MSEISIAICDDLESERIGLARMVQSYAKAHDRAIQLRLFSSGESFRDQIPSTWYFWIFICPGCPAWRRPGVSVP